MQMIDVLKRLAELDANNPNVIKENIGAMALPGLGGMEKPSAPASVNITAGSGEEVADMLATIMNLAGVHKVTDKDMGVEPPQATMTAEPMTVGEPEGSVEIDVEPKGHSSAGDDMRKVMDKMHAAGGDEEGEEKDGEEEETDECMYDNSPNDATDVPPADDNGIGPNHHENSPGQGDGMNGKPRTTFQPTATMEQRLMAEWKAFLGEDKEEEEEMDESKECSTCHASPCECDDEPKKEDVEENADLSSIRKLAGLK